MWDTVARQVERLDNARPKTTKVEEPLAPLQPMDKDPKASDPIPQFRLGERAHSTATATPTQPVPPRMDAKSFGKMRKGKLTPESRLDLHGMTVAEAHPALISFILSAQAEGKRLVLIITGKGGQASDRRLFPVQRGILRQQVPQWLRLPPLGPLILDVTPAHIRHGGDGALYVYLRRRSRK